MPAPDRSQLAVSMSADSTRLCCGVPSATCPSGPTCSAVRWPPTSATDAPTPPTLNCGTPWRSPKPRASCSRYPMGSRAGIAQGGTNVSGGQRQRLSIARALIAQPAVYLFDDSFSALDLATEARLRQALAPRTRHASVLVVAQRISTIETADQIHRARGRNRGRPRAPRRTGGHLPDLRRDRLLPERR